MIPFSLKWVPILSAAYPKSLVSFIVSRVSKVATFKVFEGKDRPLRYLSIPSVGRPPYVGDPTINSDVFSSCLASGELIRMAFALGPIPAAIALAILSVFPAAESKTTSVFKIVLLHDASCDSTS